MKQKVTLTEKQLKEMIMKAVISEGVDENFLTRVFGSSASRADAQIQDAQKVIASAQQSFGSPDEDSLEDGFNYLGDAANYLMRAKLNQAPTETMKPVVDSYMQVIDLAKSTVERCFVQPDAAQGAVAAGVNAAQGAAQGANTGGMAQDWPTAEKEINTVVKGNFSGWPKKCAAAGWSQEKIAAYQKLANAALKKPQPQAQAQPQAAPAAPAAPANQQQAAVQESLEEAVSRIIRSSLK